MTEPPPRRSDLGPGSAGAASAALRPATAQEIATALSFALRYDGRKRVHHADDAMARITADRLVRHLEQSGFVLMKRPPLGAPSSAGMVAPKPDA